MSNSCLHACPFAGLRYSAKLRFARVVRPRLAAQATATRFAGCLATLCQPSAWRVSKQVASDSRDLPLSLLRIDRGNPVTRPRSWTLGRPLSRETGSRGFLAVARRTGFAPASTTDAGASLGLGAFTSASRLRLCFLKFSYSTPRLAAPPPSACASGGCG